MHRSLLARLAAAAFFVLHCSLASARGAASIRGTVVDPDGAAVSGAQVLITARSGVVASSVTDASGAFLVEGLPPDRYDVLAAMEGFRSAPVAIELASDERSTIMVRLQVSAIAESIVVSASHVEQPLSRTPAATTVITSEELRSHQDDTVASALRRVPGLSLASNGGAGSVTSLFSRGGESDFTAVVIDGVPVNAFGGSFNFGTLTAGGVERVEVVRGPQSALWSGGAIGGIVQIITRPDARRLFDASVEGGARSSFRGAAHAAVPAGRWRMSVGGERASSEGFRGIAANGEQVGNDAWRSEHATATARYDGTTRLQVSSRWERGERGFPGPFGSDPAGTYTGVDRVSRGRDRSYLLGASASRTLSRLRPAVHAAWYRLDSDFASPFGDSESATRRATLRGDTDVRISRVLDATLGAEWLRERATSTFITGTGGTAIPVERSIASVFGEARFDAGALLVTAGARLERIHRARLEADPNPFSPRPVLPDDTEVAVAPRISASWFARPANARGEWTRLRGSAGIGIRPPDAFELAFTNNPALASERTRSVDAGVEHAFAGGLVIAEATAFANHYDDLIVTVGRSLQDASRYQSDNISNARSRGVELLVTGRARHGVRGSVAYTYLDTEVLAVDRLGVAPPPFSPGDALLRRPRHQAWVDASWHGKTASVFVSMGARGRTLDVDPNLGAFGGLFSNPGYASMDAGAGWRIVPRVEIFGRIVNLLDRRYEEVLGFPALRRGAHAGIRVAVR